MDQKHITIEQYITNEFHDLIFRKVRSFVYKNCTDYRTKYIDDIKYKELQDIWVTSLYTEGCLSEYITIKCNVRAEYKVCGYIVEYPKMGYITEMTQIWLAVDIRAKLDKKFTCVNVSDIRFIEDKSAFNITGSTSKRFIPYMQEKDLDIYATEFLKKYYPEALVEPTHLDMEELMNHMGIIAERCDARGDIFGQMFFEDTLSDDGSRTIKRGTLVYYSNSSFCEEVGSERNTIVHECVHWEYHRRYFTVQQLLNSEQSVISCTKLNVDINNPTLNTEDFRWMEYQANTLAPRILMPEQMARVKYDELLQKNKDTKTNTKGEIIKNTVVEFANFFGVSVTSAKIRLLELGYYQVRGVYDYISELGSRTYCSNKRIGKNESFSASWDDALLAQASSPKLHKAVSAGQLVFVKGFYTINDKKYICRNPLTNELELTNYALEHIDECCLLFDRIVELPKSHDNKYYSMCYLCKSAPGNTVAHHTLNCENLHNLDIFERLKDIVYVVEQIEQATQYCSELPKTFCECFQKLYKDEEFTSFNSFAKVCGLDSKVVASYYNGKSKPSCKKNVLAVISAFEIHPIVAYHVLRLFSFCIESSVNLDDRMYNYLITYYPGAGNAEWNKLLINAGHPEWIIPEHAKVKKYQ